MTDSSGHLIEFESGQLARKINWFHCFKWEVTTSICPMRSCVFAAMQWRRDELELIEDAAQSSDIAASLDNNCGVYMMPALTGLGAPHWLPNARGAIFGMTSDSGKDQIVRAALESVACQSADLPSAMESDGSVTSQLRVDGGMASNDWFCQFLSDVLNLQVIRPSNVETTAVGAAYLAGLHSGIFSSLDAVSNSWNPDHSFEPAMAPDERDYLMRRWRKAVELVSEFADR